MHRKQGSTHNSPLRLRVLSSAKVAESPGCVSQHRELVATFTEDVQNRLESTLAENKVTALGRIAGNVTKSPYGLLLHIGGLRVKELNKNRDSSRFKYELGLSRGSRGDVGQCPCSFKL